MSWINTPPVTPARWQALKLGGMWPLLPVPFEKDEGGVPFADAPNRTHYRFVMAAMLRHAPFQSLGLVRLMCDRVVETLVSEPPGRAFDWDGAERELRPVLAQWGSVLIQRPLPRSLVRLWRWVCDSEGPPEDREQGAPEMVEVRDIHAYADRVPHLIRQIAGYPWRPHLDPRWRTADAMDLAAHIWGGEWDQTPILADALQDAGCDREDVLTHLRAAGVDRLDGDWAVADVLLPVPA